MRAFIEFVEQVPGWFVGIYAWLVAHPYVLILASSALLAHGMFYLGRQSGRRDQHAADTAAMARSYSTGWADGVRKEHDVAADAVAARKRHVCADGAFRASEWTDLGYLADDGLTEPTGCPISVTAMSLVDGTDTRTLVPNVSDARMSFGFGIDPGARFTGTAGLSSPGFVVTEAAAQSAVNAWNADRNMVDE